MKIFSCIPGDSIPPGRSGRIFFCHGSVVGMTLVEVMIAVIVLGILMTGLTQIVATLVQSMGDADDHSQTSGTADFAMARMVRFVGDTDEIVLPTEEGDQLKVAERTLDMVDSARTVGGDGFLDADTDADGLVNEGAGDVKEYVSFALDKTDSDNWKLVETVPDYLTADTSDTRSQVVCEYVTGFVTDLLAEGVVRIRLTTGKYGTVVVLETRARARLLSP